MNSCVYVWDMCLVWRDMEGYGGIWRDMEGYGGVCVDMCALLRVLPLVKRHFEFVL